MDKNRRENFFKARKQVGTPALKVKASLLTLLAVVAVSCVKLDTAPYDRETDLTYWEKTESALESVNACYPTMVSAEELLYADAMSDNAYTKVTNTLNQAIGNGTYSTAHSYVKAVWDSRYAGIRVCNKLLNNIDKVPGLSNELRERYRGEARVIRDFHYFELFSKFGDVPYFTHEISISESQKIGRTPKAEVVEKLLTDLDEVIDSDCLPGSYGAADQGRITCWAAMAVKARILLFEGRWEELKKVTGRIMEEGPFRLFPDYGGLFETANENNSEVILDLQYISPDREQNEQYEFLPPSLGGYAQLAPLQELVDDYVMLNGKGIRESGSGYNESQPYLNRDPRLAATIVYTGNSYPMADGTEHLVNCDKGGGRDGFGYSSDCSPTGFYIKKYWDKTYRNTFMSGLNMILFRYADVLLMHAEALVELGQFDASAWNKTIRLIRERAGFTETAALDFPGGSQENLRNIVRRERRCELALEGLRHKDIIRYRIAEDVLNGWCHGLKTGETVGTDNGYVRVENRIFNPSKHYLWPIPQNERDLNKNLLQNPNW